MITKTVILALLIGALGGLVGALCGVGGGIILVPAFTMMMGLTQQQAVATSLAVIIPTAIAATFKNWSNDLVDWKLAVATGVGAVVVAFFAADWMKAMSNQTLTRIFAVVLIAVGVHMLVKDVKPAG